MQLIDALITTQVYRKRYFKTGLKLSKALACAVLS